MGMELALKAKTFFFANVQIKAHLIAYKKKKSW